MIFESIDYTTMCTFPSSNRVRMPSAHNFHYLRITGGILHIFSCFIFILSFIFASLLRHMMQTPLQYSNAFKCNPPQKMRNRVSKKKNFRFPEHSAWNHFWFSLCLNFILLKKKKFPFERPICIIFRRVDFFSLSLSLANNRAQPLDN